VRESLAVGREEGGVSGSGCPETFQDYTPQVRHAKGSKVYPVLWANLTVLVSHSQGVDRSIVHNILNGPVIEILLRSQ
jgi:hypothetical protein